MSLNLSSLGSKIRNTVDRLRVGKAVQTWPCLDGEELPSDETKLRGASIDLTEKEGEARRGEGEVERTEGLERGGREEGAEEGRGEGRG